MIRLIWGAGQLVSYIIKEIKVRAYSRVLGYVMTRVVLETVLGLILSNK